jgi:hypothetical protein
VDAGAQSAPHRHWTATPSHSQRAPHRLPKVRRAMLACATLTRVSQTMLLRNTLRALQRASPKDRRADSHWGRARSEGRSGLASANLRHSPGDSHTIGWAVTSARCRWSGALGETDACQTTAAQSNGAHDPSCPSSGGLHQSMLRDMSEPTPSIQKDPTPYVASTNEWTQK